MRRGYEVYSIGVGTSPTNRINYVFGHMVIALHADLFNRSVTS